MKVVGTTILKKMVQRSRAKGFNRLMPIVVEDALDPNGRHVLSKPLVHGDVECVRVTVVLLKLKDDDKPAEGVLDFSFEDWNKLPEHGEEE